MKKTTDSIEQALEDIRNGKIVMVIDDPDRENEGDFICAAEFATPENVNFMATHGKGLICMPMSSELCQQLGLKQMVEQNTDNHQTAFTVSIDGIDTDTGISAFERSATALAAVKEGAKPEDFRKPGHMFPLEARKGGVLKRTGHTEATVDLALLAGLKPCGLCCEIMRGRRNHDAYDGAVGTGRKIWNDRDYYCRLGALPHGTETAWCIKKHMPNCLPSMEHLKSMV